MSGSAMDQTISATPTASTSSAVRQMTETKIILQNLIDDLIEFWRNYLGDGKCLPNLWRTADIIYTLLATNPSITREQLLTDVLNAADVNFDAFTLPGSQDISKEVDSLGWEAIIPLPPAERARKDSFVEDRKEIYREYDPTSRGIRPPIPEPPRRFRTTTPSGVEVNLSNNTYLLHRNAGYNVREEIEKIAVQAEYEGVASPRIPSPRWKGFPELFSIDLPLEARRAWFRVDDWRAQEFKEKVEEWRRAYSLYWQKYPMREGEFETQEEADAKRAQLPGDRKYERLQPPAKNLTFPSSSPAPKAPLQSATVLGKRPRRDSNAADDEDGSAQATSSEPRLIKKLRRSKPASAPTPAAPPQSATALGKRTHLTVAAANGEGNSAEAEGSESRPIKKHCDTQRRGALTGLTIILPPIASRAHTPANALAADPYSPLSISGLSALTPLPSEYLSPSPTPETPIAPPSRARARRASPMKRAKTAKPAGTTPTSRRIKTDEPAPHEPSRRSERVKTRKSP